MQQFMGDVHMQAMHNVSATVMHCVHGSRSMLLACIYIYMGEARWQPRGGGCVRSGLMAREFAMRMSLLYPKPPTNQRELNID